MNERYTDEGKPTGKTRKSAASAKPTVKAASTVRDAPQKTKKQKKKEAQQRDAEYRAKRGITGGQESYMYSPELRKTAEYKHLRRLWGIMIGLGIACTVAAWIMSTNAAVAAYSWSPLIAAYIFIIYALYLDFSKIRKLRNSFVATKQGKSKEARAQQKELHAAAIEQRREAAAAAENGEAVETVKAPRISLPQKFRNFLARL